MILVCYCCNEYPPFKNGGIGTFVKSLAENLKSNNISSIVIGLYNIDETKVTFVNHIPVIFLKKSNIKWFGFIINKFNYYIVLRRVVKKFKIKIIEDNDWDLNTSFLPKIKNVKYILRLHHGKISVIKNIFELGILKWLLLINVIPRVNQIIGVSESIIKGYISFFKDISKKTKLIYNGVNYIPNLPQTKRNHNQILFVGTLTPNKGIFNLANALVKISEIFPSLILIVAGKDGRLDGVSISELLKIKFADINITFKYLGHLSKDELNYYYMSSRFLVLPSYFESFGLSVVESMNYGCPAIFTKNTSGPEIIDNNYDGFLVDSMNIDELIEKIKLMLTDNEIYKRFSVNCRTKVKHKFNNIELLNENISNYKKLIN